MFTGPSPNLRMTRRGSDHRAVARNPYDNSRGLPSLLSGGRHTSSRRTVTRLSPPDRPSRPAKTAIPCAPDGVLSHQQDQEEHTAHHGWPVGYRVLSPAPPSPPE